jgi:hypothetical protein
VAGYALQELEHLVSISEQHRLAGFDDFSLTAHIEWLLVGGFSRDQAQKD